MTVASRSAFERISCALLAALGAELRGLALPFGLHALVDRLAVLLRQIGAADPHVDHLDAVLIGLPVELVADARHQAPHVRRAPHVMKVTSPSTRRSAAFNSVVSWMLAAWIEPML